jgi:hypothetical protein
MAETRDRRKEVKKTIARALLTCALACLSFASFASPADAAEHLLVTGEYGKEGPKATGLGNGCRIGYDSASERLYLYSDSKIYGLQRSGPGTASPLGGGFPINLGGLSSSCGDRDLTVDNSSTGSAGRIYITPSNALIYGYNPSGTALSSPWPVNFGGGEVCGVAVGNDGNVFGGFYSGSEIRRYSPAGVLGSTIPFGQNLCKLETDQSTNDLFASGYGSQTLFKLTAASSYATKSTFFSVGTGNPGLAVNGVEDKLYVATGSSVKAYDTNTAALIETISPGGSVSDVAVDEATDSLFITVGEGSGGVIKEYAGVKVPKATTGDPIGNTEVSGTADPNEAGNITECYFEFGIDQSFGSTEPCAESLPITGVQSVHADLSGLSMEQTYYYRLVLGTGAPGIVGRGAAKTITPHHVDSLTTDPAEEVTRTSAKLKAHFKGNGEDTKYYFEWGADSSYGSESATPPGPNIGNPSGPTNLSFEATGLQAETLYHYRVVAENGGGVSHGDDRTFETLSPIQSLSTDPPTEVTPKEADLNASFVGDGTPHEYFFEWGATTAYGTKTPTEEFTPPPGQASVPPVTITDLQPLHTYHYRVVVTNGLGTNIGEDVVFTTPSAPVVVSQSTSHVTATEGELHAVINPHGADTEYHFEYGPTPNYGASVPVPDGLIPAGETNQSVEAHLTGLNGGVYHFRVVARSIHGVTKSVDQTFNFYPPVCPNSTVRQQTGSNSLPDCRAYELVTPEDQGITIIYTANFPFSPTATSPSRLVFGGAWGSIDGVGEPMNWNGDKYVATRTALGWKTKYVGLPSSEAPSSGSPPWTVSSGSQIEPDKWGTDVLATPSLSAIVDWNGGYYPCTPNFCQGYGNGEGYKSSNAPYVWNSTTGRQIDRWPTNVGAIPGGETFKGRTAASADLNHFVFTSDIPFTTDGQPGDMYDNETGDGSLEVASLDANAERIPAAPVELSADGSHVLMTVGGGRQPGYSYEKTSGPGELYMRVDGAITYEIAPGSAVRYLDMTPDGKKVYFTSSVDLTDDNSDTDTSRDIYMWTEAGGGQLTLVSKGNDPTTGNTDACSASWIEKCNVEAINFQSYTIAAGGAGGNPYSDNFVAEGAGDIYFLSPEQLHGANGFVGMENLYVYRNGKLQFVTSLDPASKACTENQGELNCSDNSVARMEVTPDDGHMAFLTGSQVTAYDNAGHSELYVYTPATDEMICASCLPSGESPDFDVTTSHNGRFLTNDGRTFFETQDPLVPQDTNAAKDVYEYVEGRPQLITSGTAPANEVFGVGSIGTKPGLVGVSADGTDVYFATYDVLVGQDRNGEALKIYDARSGGGFNFPAPVPPCVAADECHGPSSSPPATPATGTTSDLGVSGNLQPARKKQTRRGKARHKRKQQRRKAHRRGHRNG